MTNEVFDIIESFGFAESYHLGSALDVLLGSSAQFLPIDDSARLVCARAYLKRWREELVPYEIVAYERALERFEPQQIAERYSRHPAIQGAIVGMLDAASIDDGRKFFEQIDDVIAGLSAAIRADEAAAIARVVAMA